jgi:hypothetical protein
MLPDFTPYLRVGLEYTLHLQSVFITKSIWRLSLRRFFQHLNTLKDSEEMLNAKH